MGVLEVYFPNEYVGSLVVLLIVFIAVRLFIFIVSKILPKLAAKTKTDIDDKILAKVSRPITWIAMIVGLRFVIGQVGLGETYAATVDGIFATLIIVFASFLIYHILDSIIVIGFSEFGKKAKLSIDLSLIQFFESMIKILVIVGTFLAILSTWGIEIGPLLAGLGVAGIAIAFALQPTLSNIFGGISMLLDKSVRVGDLIKLEDGTSGRIQKVNLRSTKLITFDNELIIVPNSKLSESNIQNIALPEPKTRVVVPFGVAYGSDIAKVKRIVLKELSKIKHKVDEPEPSVKFLEMADSSLNFKAYFYVDSYENKLSSLDEANTLIYNVLNKTGIEIPFPQVDVNLKK
ncbi:MAG: mechanosensitive ion channel family protein [Nanoarchaeota archaeon]|nr:mechanosensitive ion channel family protein [Nanoarchaeota archaeon]